MSTSTLLTGAVEEVEVSRVDVLPTAKPYEAQKLKKNSSIFADKLTIDKNCDLCGD